MGHKRYFISACLLGQKVRYDGKDCLVSQLVQALLDKNYVSLCPEVSAGLPTRVRQQKFATGQVLMFY